MRSPAPVSVIVPVLNASDFIGEALASISEQSLPPAEIIVVDNGSTDGSDALAAAHPGVRLVREPREGVGYARNRGVAECTQPFIAFLDADDVWVRDKLEHQFGLLQAQPAIGLVFGQAIEFRELGENGIPIPVRGPIDAYLPAALLVRRSSFERVGPYPEGVRVGDVIDWYARAVDLGEGIRVLPEVVFWRRLHANNLGRRMQEPGRDYLRVLRSVIERRRDER